MGLATENAAAATDPRLAAPKSRRRKHLLPPRPRLRIVCRAASAGRLIIWFEVPMDNALTMRRGQ
ncbi:MAG TPA: hypothetical protein PLW65_22650, partial [Pseudomonadota bacterium]|nr:hypothetical protein [Pseudomonadota bacterium]